jgi:hypothetical protein
VCSSCTRRRRVFCDIQSTSTDLAFCTGENGFAVTPTLLGVATPVVLQGGACHDVRHGSFEHGGADIVRRPISRRRSCVYCSKHVAIGGGCGERVSDRSADELKRSTCAHVGHCAFLVDQSSRACRVGRPTKDRWLSGLSWRSSGFSPFSCYSCAIQVLPTLFGYFLLR